jgi:hypothetical protein
MMINDCYEVMYCSLFPASVALRDWLVMREWVRRVNLES